MGLPYIFQNAPYGVPTYWSQFSEFFLNVELANFDFTSDGAPGCHNAPTVVSTIYDSGSVVLGSGSTVSGSYIQMQSSPANMLSTRLGKTYLFLSQFSISSATLAMAQVGMFAAGNSNLLNTNAVNGFGAYANLTNGASATNWTFFSAASAGSQFGGYSQIPGPVVDTNIHVFGVLYRTDPNNLGGGSMYFVWDTVTYGPITAPSVNSFPQVALAASAALGNGSGAAQSMTMFGLGIAGQN